MLNYEELKKELSYNLTLSDETMAELTQQEAEKVSAQAGNFIADIIESTKEEMKGCNRLTKLCNIVSMAYTTGFANALESYNKSLKDTIESYFNELIMEELKQAVNQ